MVRWWALMQIRFLRPVLIFISMHSTRTCLLWQHETHSNKTYVTCENNVVYYNIAPSKSPSLYLQTTWMIRGDHLAKLLPNVLAKNWNIFELEVLPSVSALLSQSWINAPSTNILGCQYGQGPCGKVGQAAIKAIQNSSWSHTHSWDWVSTTLISQSWILCARFAQQLQLTGSNKDFSGRKVMWSEASLFTCTMQMR